MAQRSIFFNLCSSILDTYATSFTLEFTLSLAPMTSFLFEEINIVQLILSHVVFFLHTQVFHSGPFSCVFLLKKI